MGNDLSESRSPMHGNSWQGFLDIFQKNNFEIELNNFHDTDFDGLICFNFVKPMKECKSIFSSEVPFKALVILEPKVVHPLAHSIQILNHFNIIISTSPKWNLADRQMNFKYPLVVDTFDFTEISKRKISVAMIQANKFSCIKGEQYSLRRNLVNRAINGDLPLTLAGPGWDESKNTLRIAIFKYFLKTFTQVNFLKLTNPFRFLISNPNFWIGPVDNKISFLDSVKRNVVIENSNDYVSEKLIDSFRAGSVPFYVGPDLSNFGIPPNLIVECEPTVSDIIYKLKSTSDNKLQEIQNNISLYLSSGGLNEWNHSFASLKIANRIIEEFHKTSNQS